MNYRRRVIGFLNLNMNNTDLFSRSTSRSRGSLAESRPDPRDHRRPEACAREAALTRLDDGNRPPATCGR